MSFTFEQAFSEDSIIAELCKERVKIAKQRSDDLFYYRIVPDNDYRVTSTNQTRRVYSLFPPRRRWHQYRPRRRGTRASTDLNLRSLISAVRHLRLVSRDEYWVKNLDETIARIRARAMAVDFAFSRVRIVPLAKVPRGHQYRPLAIFENLEDKIIDRLTARYLRENVDSALSKSCFAFRCRRGKKATPTTHSALDKLLQLNNKHRRTGLYVAECDIKGFFDCVSHKVALRALRDLITDKQSRTKTFKIDERALRIFEAYLHAYSFPLSVRKGARKELRLKDPKGEFKWPESDLKVLHRKPRINQVKDVGVPQGGALSCFIANAVLHSADKALDQLNESSDTKFLYIRYCDDMILVSPSQTVCRKALSVYSTVLRRKLLPVHPPERVRRYDKAFWEGKSHLPYLWAGPKNDTSNAIPWIQFVGYQIRYDGLIRIRRRSFKKHLTRLTSEADKLLAVLRRGANNRRESLFIRKTAAQIQHRLRQKLISLSVGRIRLGKRLDEPHQMCWTGGFRGLAGKRIVSRWIRALDRHRERQIWRVAKELKKLRTTSGTTSQKEGFCKYYGAPFSYWGQFAKVR